MKLLSDFIRGKSVALVGNASSLLRRPDGQRIDAHDVVIRINLGLPKIIGTAEAIGRRTDVWVAAKCWGYECHPHDVKLISFTKITKIGDRDWANMQRILPRIPMERWTHEMAEECTRECCCDPGSGLRTLWALKRKCEPKSVTVYGFDCWETTSNWSGRMQTPNHDPGREKVMVEKLCAL